MRKNFLLTTAITVTAFFVGTMIAEAASVTWGGQLRPRFEYNEQSAFNSNGTAGGASSTQETGDYFVSTRIRLHAKVDILPDTSAFIQLQSVRTWGNDIGGTAAGANGGSGNAAFSPNDGDASIGVHQAYFTLKNFATLPVDLKLGRQQVVLDGHRLFGHTGWTQGAQTHDAVRLTHHEGNHTLSYIYSLANEGSRGTTVGTSANDQEDIEVHIFYANMQGILGGGLSLYFISLDDDCSAVGGTCTNSTAFVTDNNIYTIGARQAGQLFGLDYRAEYYYQFGNAEGDAAVLGAPYARVGSSSDVFRSAYMFGARVGKKFNNVMWKPSITIWYDYLSGTSDEDARTDNEFNTFNTLFDTGHKFYGLMDLFLPASGANTNQLGLVDYAVKTSIQPAKGWKLKADWHYFTTAEGITANSAVSGATGTSDGNELGNELDITLVHKYNANTTISAGWSHFWQEEGFEVVNGAASSVATVESADWAYVQFDVKF